ncbi:tetratricopeptide repeat protein [Roseiflexus sp.]
MDDPQDLINQGIQCFNRGEYHRAIAFWQEAAARSCEKGDTGNELEALACIPVAWGNIPDGEKMIEAATRLLARARALRHKKYEMQAALRLAEALSGLDLRGRWRELKPLLLEGLETARQLGDHWWEVYHLKTLGYCAVSMEEEEQGLAWLQEALNAIRPGMDGEHYFRGEINSSLSRLMRQRGDLAEALRYAEIAVNEFRQHGNPNFVSAQLTLARAEWARGELAEALRLVEEMLPRARQMGWKGTGQDAEYLRGELLREMGHPERAEPSARRALKLAREMKLKEEEVACLLSLGQVLLALKRREEAREVLQQARRLSQERDYEDHFQRAEQLLTLAEGKMS